jgi:hypothetical protein
MDITTFPGHGGRGAIAITDIPVSKIRSTPNIFDDIISGRPYTFYHPAFPDAVHTDFLCPLYVRPRKMEEL